MNSKPIQKNSQPGPKAGKNKKKKAAQKALTLPPLPQQQFKPVAVSTGMISMSPKFTFGNKSCRIVHRELCLTVTTTNSDDFDVRAALALNPGIANTFIWLSTQALGWEQYKFHMLRFRYLTRTGSSTAGSVMLIPDYDAADAAPTSEFTASSYEDCREDVIWKDQLCVLDPKAMCGLVDRHNTRFGALNANLDIKTYDVGNLYVAVVGTGSAPANIGKLWVEYDVEFFKPQLPPGGVAEVYGGLVTGGNMSAGNPYGTTATVNANSVGISVDNASNLTISNPGTYAISSGVTGTGITGGLSQTLVSGVAANIHSFGAVNTPGTFSDSTSTWNVTGVPATFSNTISGATTITQLLQTIALAPNGAL